MKHLLLFVLGVPMTLLMSCSSKPEPMEHTKEHIVNIRQKIGNILKEIPEKGKEEAIDPEGIIQDMGVNESKEYMGVPTIDEKYMPLIAAGTEEENATKGIDWLSQGYWHRMGPNGMDYMYDEYNLEMDMETMHGVSQLVVFRTESVSYGKVKGDEILEPGKFKGWIWLIDWKTEKIVAARSFEAVTDDNIYTMREGNIMANNLQSNILGAAVWILNKWAGTSDEKYLGLHYIQSEN